jgi:hypothetical protein
MLPITYTNGKQSLLSTIMGGGVALQVGKPNRKARSFIETIVISSGGDES